MLTTNEFLAAVLPDSGRYCVVGIKDKSVQQKFIGSVGDIERLANGAQAKGRDAYFALATFAADKRVAVDAQELKCFFIDIDCGYDNKKQKWKPYKSKQDGLVALRDFCKATTLPRPIIVDSGRGIHAYWPLTQAIPAREWGPLAERLKAMCTQHKFEIDPSVPADKARVLRVPGTLNFKDTPPAPVQVLRMSDPVDPDFYRELLKTEPDPLAVLDTAKLANAARHAKDPTTERLMGNFTAKFRTILAKSAEGKGCAQVLHAFSNQDSIEEPLWRAVLSIANVCSDKDKAVHVMSNKHPEYNAQEALRKASATKGPYTCATFKNLNPEVCAGCPRKITSPIQLGKEFIEPEQGEVVVDAEGAPVQEPSDEASKTDVVPAPTYKIPSYPAPFLRGTHGGIYVKGKDADGAPTTDLVYPYDLYVVKRINDPDIGEMIMVRLHLPKDGVREFLIPLSVVLAKDKLRDTLAMHGVTAIGKRQELLMVYLTRWVEELQTREQAQKARKQFGWTENYESFVIGEREIFEDHIKYSPPSNTTLPLIPHYTAQGSLGTWSQIVSHYATPGLEAKALTLFLGFGNLLLGMTNVQGYWLSLYSQASGSGKTTALRAVASIFGAPRPILMRVADTDNMFWNRVGVHNNLPVLFDEITNMDPERASKMVYNITEGRAKGRLQAHSNVERNNHSHWCTGVMSSSNESLRDKLTKNKLLPDGELMRMLEFFVPEDTSMSAKEADAYFGQLDHNYGHAIVPFVQYVMRNLGEVKRRVESARTKLAEAINMAGPERFWVTMGALAVVGGEIANELDLVNIPVPPVRDFFIAHLHRSRRSNVQLKVEASDFLGDFLRRRVREMLIINGKTDNRTGLETAALQEPMNGLSIRFEPDTKMLYISAKEYKSECQKLQYPYESSLAKHSTSGAFMGMARKRIAQGSKYNTGTSVPVLVFDTSKIATFDAEALANEAAKTDDTDTVVQA